VSVENVVFVKKRLSLALAAPDSPFPFGEVSCTGVQLKAHLELCEAEKLHRLSVLLQVRSGVVKALPTRVCHTTKGLHKGNTLKALFDFKASALLLLEMIGPDKTPGGPDAEGSVQRGSAWAMFILGPLMMDMRHCSTIGIAASKTPLNGLGFISELKDFATEENGSAAAQAITSA